VVQDRTNAVQRCIVWEKNIHQRLSNPVRQAADDEPVLCDTVVKIVIIQLVVTSPPTCPDCDSQWVGSASPFVVDEKLSHLSTSRQPTCIMKTENSTMIHRSTSSLVGILSQLEKQQVQATIKTD
jgi:hypothetical protein